MITKSCPDWRVAFGLMLCMLGGCTSRNSAIPDAADPAIARVSLERAMSRWRQGKSPDALQSSQPPITVADEDWHAGRRLLSFQLLSGEAQAGATLRWPVRLRLARSDGREQVIQTTYIVSHSRTIHIARSD